MNKKPRTHKIHPRHAARQLCVQALYQWHIHQQTKSAQTIINEFYQQLIDDTISHDENWVILRNQADKKMFEQLFIAIVKEQSFLDAQLVPILDRPLAELDPIELSILRLETYEMRFSIAVPYRVIINEGIELAKHFGATDSYKYINSVLDKLAIQFRSSEIQQR